MISTLADLETRRKILFVDNCLTIRTIGTDAVLVTVNNNTGLREAIRNALSFLTQRSQLVKLQALIIDVSQARNLSLIETLAFRKANIDEFKRFAVLTKNFRTRILFHLLRPYSGESRYRIFRDLASAINWIRII